VAPFDARERGEAIGANLVGFGAVRDWWRAVEGGGSEKWKEKKKKKK
jgi:hypothetical protein